ncbi:protein translocase subunit secG [Mariniphaga anaerophila]|uniref:Protein-export membrane protein SecG n=1 Tax=Mariniphaga anaerophila TaxID=1484053 RepID=A0A1M4YGU0_9BACT|nr:preprotein translocase subunit SecG [Mariniphaga anaerophila]SHF04666.1 protein translocase subunit secG [Mariniphaga anaerophila]
MYALITVLIFIVCVLLILIVLVQNSKGGGLASNFQSSNQIMGVRKTTDFLEKATWVLAGALLVLSIMGSAFIPREQIGQEQSRVREQVETAVDPTQVPNFPTTAPEATTDENAPAPATEDGDQQ